LVGKKRPDFVGKKRGETRTKSREAGGGRTNRSGAERAGVVTTHKRARGERKKDEGRGKRVILRAADRIIWCRDKELETICENGWEV